MADDFDRMRMQMQDELLHDGHLSPATRLVGIELLRRVNRSRGYCWPSGKTLAECLFLNRDTVIAAIAELEESGWFQVDRNVRGRSNHYWPRFVDRTCRKFRQVFDAEVSEIPTPGVGNSDTRGGENPTQSPLGTPNINRKDTTHEAIGGPLSGWEHRKRRNDKWRVTQAALAASVDADAADEDGEADSVKIVWPFATARYRRS